MNTTTTTPAETVAALKRHEIAAAEIVVQSATIARWVNYIDGRDVETVHEFKPGDVLTLRDWRPEGMTTTTPDGREMFIFWHYLEAMTTADEIRAAFVWGLRACGVQCAHIERGKVHALRVFASDGQDFIKKGSENE